MMKFFSAPLIMAFFYLFLGSGTLASSDVLSFKNFDEFKRFHKSVIQVLIKRESLTSYPDKLILETVSDKELSAIDFYSFFLSSAYASTPEHLCFFGGWPSVRTRNSRGIFKCRAPWTMRDRSEISSFDPKYDSNHYCGAKTLFRCNPTIFGPGDDGKGTCITIANYNNVTSACYEKSQENIETIYQKYMTDPEFKIAYNKMSEEIMTFCREHPDYSACTNLKQSVEKFYELVCSREPTPVLSPAVSNTVGIIDRVINYFSSGDENPPVAPEPAATPVVDPDVDPELVTREESNITLTLSTSDTPTPVAPDASPTEVVPTRDIAADILNTSPQAVATSIRPRIRPDDLDTSPPFSIPSNQEAISFVRLRSRPFYNANNRQLSGLYGNLTSPLSNNCSVTSRFNPARRLGGRLSAHPGTDLSAARGTRVNAIARGRIVRTVGSCRDQRNGTSCNSGFGNQVFIMHSRNGVKWYSSYNHMTSVTVGNRTVVEAGEQIGTVGNTGYSFGSHLHIEIMDSNQKRSNLALYYSGGDICGN